MRRNKATFRKRLRLALILVSAGLQGVVAGQIKIDPILGLRGDTSEPSLSPDFKVLAFSLCKPNHSCGLYLRHLSGGPVTLLTRSNGKDLYETSPQWSRDGRTIAFERWYSHYVGRLCVRNVSSGKEKDLGPIAIADFSWSPDGKFLAASEYVDPTNIPNDTRIVLISANGLLGRRQLAGGNVSALSPLGGVLAYADGNVLKLLRLGRITFQRAPQRRLPPSAEESAAFAGLRTPSI